MFEKEEIIDEVKSFIVYIDDKGYYADKQQGSLLNFTDDYHYAKKYKTKKGAINLIKQFSEDNIKEKCYIQPLNIKQICEFKLDKMQDIIIEKEEKNDIIFTKPVHRVEICYPDINDDFWN